MVQEALSHAKSLARNHGLQGLGSSFSRQSFVLLVAELRTLTVLLQALLRLEQHFWSRCLLNDF